MLILSTLSFAMESGGISVIPLLLRLNREAYKILRLLGWLLQFLPVLLRCPFLIHPMLESPDGFSAPMFLA